jgi:hypothetical protein
MPDLNSQFAELIDAAQSYLQTLSKTDSHRTVTKRLEISHGRTDLTKSMEKGFESAIPLEYVHFHMISSPPNVEASGKLTEGSIIMGPLVLAFPMRADIGSFLSYFEGETPLDFSIVFLVKEGGKAHIKRGYGFEKSRVLSYNFFRTPLGDDYMIVIVVPHEIEVLERGFDPETKRPIGVRFSFKYKVTA